MYFTLAISAATRQRCAALVSAATGSDRASWAAAVAGRLGEPDPVMVAAFLALGYPVGAATPFRGVRALGARQGLAVTGGRLVMARDCGLGADSGAGSYDSVAAALADEVRPLGERGAPVELSLTGGKDSRLIAAALTAAKVPFLARTHGFASHPDVIVAAMIASRLGVEHVVTEPRSPTREQAADQAADDADLLARLRSAVLVSDGMLSAFENVGRHMVTRRLGLLRPAAGGEYLASLAPFAATLPRGPLRTLDDFYRVNRAGRWSAAARQAYLIRSQLVQPFFSDRVVQAARAVPLPDRITDRLHRGVLAALCPELLDLPLAGSGWKSGPRTPPVRAAAAAGPAGASDWRRAYGDQMARLLRDYTLDLGAAGGMFDLVRRSAAERALRLPQQDSHAVWALATLAALLSGDWLNARGGEISRGRTASPPARRTPLPPRA